MIIQQDVQNLVDAANNAGYMVNIGHLSLVTWNAGIATHNPTALPIGFSAVYIFEHPFEYLKIGKACGDNANPRYQSQHYYKKASSSLAKSLERDPIYSPLIGGLTLRDWIRTNTSRYNILIPNIYNKHFLNFAEAFFILKCNPKFEGS